MATNQLKIVLSLLKEFSEGNSPRYTDYDIDNEIFGSIIESMEIEGLIRGSLIQRAGQGNKIIIMNLDNVKVSIKGLEYMNENSTLMKTYKGLKEIREWLPF